MPEPAIRGYEPEPCYPPVGGDVGTGWTAACAGLSDRGVLAVDGPNVLDWPALVAAVTRSLEARGTPVTAVDVREQMVPWDLVVKRTAPVAELADDPDFATLAGGRLADLFDERPAVPHDPGGVVLAYGPGAALAAHDVLWYADLPKRYAETAVVAGAGHNLGQAQADEGGTTRRLFYIDWPLLDRHRDALASRVELWVDMQRPTDPTWLTGDVLRGTLARLARMPFRTRPTFNTTSWGGHWGQRELGMNTQAPNTALGYELIAPESGILVGVPGRVVEVPFQLAVALHPERVLGGDVHARFATSFPIRFDYLDTVDGGSLSVHCHPREAYMRDVFGWPYTQHETYYLMLGDSNDSATPGTPAEDRIVYLGLRDGADVAEFHRQAHDADAHGAPFDIEEFVQTYPATPHQLFLIPAGTPHGSGRGNVVLEVSATPYLYSLRFYDWLRYDAAGRQRPVHVEHAFRNLDAARTYGSVREDLVQQPRTVRGGDGWREDVIGALPEMFFEVRRLELEPGATLDADTAGTFHVLNVVDGDGALIDTEGGRHDLAYAETLVVPAAVGTYSVTALGSRPVRIVKAFVP